MGADLRSGLPSIGWITGADESYASFRFRCQAPMHYLENNGYSVGRGRGDITIVLKDCLERPEEILQHKESTVLIWDVCDDHFDTERGPYYRRMCELVHHVTCSTPVLARKIEEETGVKATVISDPLEYERKPPVVRGPMNVLWYGHSSNMRALYAIGKDLQGYTVRGISTGEIKTPGIRPWSHQAMMEGLEWCDVVIIPIGERTEKQPAKEAKSPNRMTEAINAGRYVVANDMPAYRGFRMYLGDIAEGLQWLKTYPKECLLDLQMAQMMVTERHSPAVIGKQWMDYLNSIWAVETSIGRAS